MVWAARGSGNHSRPFTPAQACLGAGATPAAGCLEGRLCVPASPARRPRLGPAPGSSQCRQREVIYSRFRGEGSGLDRGLPKRIFFVDFFYCLKFYIFLLFSPPMDFPHPLPQEGF